MAIIQLPKNIQGIQSIERTGKRPLWESPKKSGYNNTEVAGMVKEFERRMKLLLKEIPKERERFTKWLKETGFVNKHGKRVFDYNKLDKYDRKKAVVQQGFSQISQGVEEGISRVFASIGQTHPDFAKAGLKSFADTLSEALASGTNEGARIVYDKWQRNLIAKAGFLKTGHHVEPLMALWPELLKLPEKIRQQTLARLSGEGFKFGESSLEAIFQIIHRESDLTNLSKSWQSALGGVGKTWLDTTNPQIKAKAANKLAHASRIGGTSGGGLLKPPKDLLKGVDNAEEAVQLLRPFVRVAKNAGDLSEATSKALEHIITNKDGTLKSAEQIQSLIKDGSFERAIDSVPDIGIIDQQDFSKYKGVINKIKNRKHIGDDVPAAMDLVKNINRVSAGGIQYGATATLADPNTVMQGFDDAAKKIGHGAAEQLDKLRKFGDAEGARRAATMAGRWGMVNPLMLGTSSILGAYALSEREKEVAANPNDRWLKFQLQLDRAALGGDVTGLATTPFALSGYGAAIPAASEVISNVAGGTSLVLDFGRYIKTEEGRQQMSDIWQEVYSRGSNQLYRGINALF